MTKRVWIDSANHEEQGSFSDVESGIVYENVTAFQAEVENRTAEERGIEAIALDAPADPTDSYGPDQRFNLYRTEQDDQGTDTAAKHRVGGV